VIRILLLEVVEKSDVGEVCEWFVSEVFSGFLLLIVSSGGALVLVDVGDGGCM
jgi:hypothetical protein